jgi:prepilin-type N-terminal cleavage/methylation domain-containing protein
VVHSRPSEFTLIHRRGFTLLELLVCIAVIAVLLGILLPTLMRARSVAHRSLCASNLRQIGVAWALYVQDNNDRLPRNEEMPSWKYGGVEFIGPQRVPVLAQSRPINAYMDEVADEASQVSRLFLCPSDVGVTVRSAMQSGQPGASVLDGGSCFNTFGNSYRANELLLDASLLRTGDPQRPLALHEITTTHSRVLLTGDPAWYFATRVPRDPQAANEASWHNKPDAGNMLAVDGSVRFLDFRELNAFTLGPR